LALEENEKKLIELEKHYNIKKLIDMQKQKDNLLLSGEFVKASELLDKTHKEVLKENFVNSEIEGMSKINVNLETINRKKEKKEITKLSC